MNYSPLIPYKDKITEIVHLCIDAQNTKKCTAFFEFAAHVGLIGVRIYTPKWKDNDTPAFKFSAYTDDNLGSDPTFIEQKIVDLRTFIATLESK